MKNNNDKFLKELILMFYTDFSQARDRFIKLYQENPEIWDASSKISIRGKIESSSTFDFEREEELKDMFMGMKIDESTLEFDDAYDDETYYFSAEFVDNLKDGELEEINDTILNIIIEENNLKNLEDIRNFLNNAITKNNFFKNLVDTIREKTLKKFVSDETSKRMRFRHSIDLLFNLCFMDESASFGIYGLENVDDSNFDEDILHECILFQVIVNYINNFIHPLLQLFTFSYANYMIINGNTNEKLKDFTKVNSIFDKEKTNFDVKKNKLSELFYDLIIEEYKKVPAYVKEGVVMSSDSLLNSFLVNDMLYEALYKFCDAFDESVNVNKNCTIKEFTFFTYPLYIKDMTDDNTFPYIIFLITYFIKNRSVFKDDDLDIIKVILNQTIFKYINEINDIIRQAKNKKELDRILNNDIGLEISKSSLLTELENVKNGYEFEEFVAHLYQKLGYECNVTSKSKDQGADILVTKKDESIVVQAKYYSNPVGNKAVQEVVSSKAYYNAKKAIVVTNSTFTNSAIQLAFKNRVELIDGSMIKEIINELEM